METTSSRAVELMAANNEAALPYHEPGIVTILILTSFILLLNLSSHVIDKLLYCGLLAQIFLGIAWSTPGAAWLSHELEVAVVDLGYLGLLLIVYEGGLSTSWKALKQNWHLSVGVAATGIAVPIGLSYVLAPLVGATALQAFAAGAALCSTSLGTTFTIMSASGLTTTRLGTILTSAAMLDDVVGLVMVQVISNLGGSAAAFETASVIRPVLVSLALMVAVPATAKLIVGPVTNVSDAFRLKYRHDWLDKVLSWEYAPLLIHTAILIGLVIGASYAGTSNLLAAYLAGASISWWDSDILRSSRHAVNQRDSPCLDAVEGGSPPGTGKSVSDRTEALGVLVFSQYYEPTLRRIPKPFFFASIGFSIPITRMFNGTVVWKGIIYTILMFLGKLVCGLWLFRLPGTGKPSTHQRSHNVDHDNVREESGKLHAFPEATTLSQCNRSCQPTSSASTIAQEIGQVEPPQHRPTLETEKHQYEPDNHGETTAKRAIFYPGCILGSAMVARGEIGFLISALAESNGIYGTERNGPLFLTVTWAIVLCTVIGPLLVGLLVRQMRTINQDSYQSMKKVLGVWGE